jgi:hypothetical protein
MRNNAPENRSQCFRSRCIHELSFFVGDLAELDCKRPPVEQMLHCIRRRSPHCEMHLAITIGGIEWIARVEFHPGISKPGRPAPAEVFARCQRT